MSLVNEDLEKDKPDTNGGGVTALSDRRNKFNGSIQTMSKDILDFGVQNLCMKMLLQSMFKVIKL